ncbi:histone-lysine N-methyltransferase SETMAR-like [Pogonomyrmex barbatus]|uniref:Histone-lysine N-methyltransferase SETMAR-like n=1 Tax=Pogonomyrmex barbatus TaxID=144034 RepID=A0A6I9WFT3_9HYME|nr:histone-lysine N-methyltransferase SETMAR-like [Pogonomyrmex barbatus]
MLYKNISANDGSRNFVLVILISTMLLSQGGPTEIDDDKIKALIESTLHDTRDCRNIEHHSSVHDYLKKLEYVSKLDIWIPYELKEVHLMARINICNMLIKREENDSFLKRLISGEKLIVYNNVMRKWS